MTASIFWYDFETTGTSPARDRPIQVAGLRTNEALEEVAPPLMLYCRLSDDILPHPGACLVTGITPGRLAQEGVGEAEFIARLHAEMSRPGTCSAGYNSLRFDDEVMRYSLYRNFFDPYAREWQNGNSRWDLIDLMRAAYALRPEGIVWPEEAGRVSLRLESLTAANGLPHATAHDALSDVRATIALARLVRERQPRLYAYLYQLRSKARVKAQVRLLQPLVHVSGRFSAQRHYLSVVLPLAWHPRNANALIVADLGLDPSPLWLESAEVLRHRLYLPREQLGEGELPIPLKLIHVNRCPVVAPLAVLRPADRERLNLDLSHVLMRGEELVAHQAQWQEKLLALYQEEGPAPGGMDPEQQLYKAFLGNRDRHLCESLRNGGLKAVQEEWCFDDERLNALLFRYRARNYPQTLGAQEISRWQTFCRQRLMDAQWGAPNTLESFRQALQQLWPSASQEQRALLQVWQEHAAQLAHRYGCRCEQPEVQ